MRTAEPQNRRTALSRLGWLAVVLISTIALAQAQPQFPPVPGNDVQQKGYGLWQNTGWVIDTDSQLREDVLFVSEGGLPRTFIRKDATISFTHAVLDTAFGGTDTLRRLDMSVVGAEALYPDALGSSAKIEERHFYLPHCGPTGVTNVVGYNRIVYPNVYPLIDLWVFSGTLGQKVMFVMWPGADPKDIELEFTGQNELGIDVNGWLKILLEDKWITLPQPVAYQFDQSNTILPLLWAVEYEPQGNGSIVTLNYDAYDPSKPLVFLIGPPPMGGMSQEGMGLCWSTFVGDDGTDNAEEIRADSQGNVYITGRTSSTLVQFPADPGLINASSGNHVAFLSKFTSAFQPSWAVFIGGDALLSVSGATSLAIRESPQQRIYFGGSTQAQDFFGLPNGGAYYDGTNTNSTYKGFISEVNQFGQLQWSTYFGEHDVYIEGMDIIPSLGHLAICGQAQDDLPDEQYDPLTGELDQAHAGGWDGFMALFDMSDQLYMRSWCGGSLTDGFHAVRGSGSQIFFAGTTESDDIDLVDPGGGAYAQSFGGFTDVLLVELNHQGNILWSTYLGGPGLDQIGENGLAIGPERDVFLCGSAANGFPIEQGPNWYDNVAFNPHNGFIARFSGSDRSEEWLTYIGGGNPDVCTSIVQAPDGTISVAGYSNGIELPYLALPGWYDQPTQFEYFNGGFLVRFNDAQQLLHGTWFGGDATTAWTYMKSITPYNGGVMATGFLQKGTNILSYWPLDDGNGTAWMDDQYNHLGQSIQFSDAFITYFCSELSVGVARLTTQPTTRIILDPDGTIELIGLPDGRFNYSLVDKAGRELLQGSLLSNSGRSNALSTLRLASGVYVIRVEGHGGFRFLKN